MKSIVSWNVNGIRAIYKKNFLDWLEREKPDILCIQETKAQEDQLDTNIKNPLGYKSFFASALKKGYSGVAIYCKKKPLKIEKLGVSEFDNEGRVQIAHFDSFILINCYFPNSQEKGKRLDYKLSFCEHLLKKVDEFKNKKILICGDYNIAHKPIDLEHPDRNEENPGYLPEEREWMDTFIEKGFIDTFRLFDETPKNYTWWSYRTKARERNVGWRIDYHCCNELLKKDILSSEILNDVMGSDHCPVKIILK